MTYNIDKALWGGEATFDQLLADIRSRRSEIEGLRYIPQDIIERFKEIGIYRAFVPKKFGGDAKTPRQFLEVIEAISAADGSAGWVASFGMSPAYLAGLPMSSIEQVWDDSPDVVFAGGAFPSQPVVEVEGGYKVSGRWPFGSGCKGASLIGVAIKIEGAGPLPQMAVMPADLVTIDESSWQVHGMASSGSFDLVVDDVFVAKEWVFERGGKPTLDSPFFRYPSLSISAQVLSVTALGVAREAIDMVVAMSVGQKTITGAPKIGDRHYAQIEIAKAEAKVRSSRAFFYQATDDAWSTVMEGDKPSPEQASLLRLATTNLTRECADATQIAYRLAGMSSTYYDNHLSRCYRDVNMPTQHALMGEVTYQNAGAMMFGQDPFPGYV
ncbi:MAG: alkylation response protein AidB-like acyl-CoA dehydrogenase [Arenicella sp.]|jgi:alkylation response protein AidB-like acyl-CoA dehydrogenase